MNVWLSGTLVMVFYGSFEGNIVAAVFYESGFFYVLASKGKKIKT